jgi:enoyl-CoA hydratase/carnithine racemase
LKISVKDKILVCVLDAPERGNAFSLKDAEALSAALKKYIKDDGIDGLLLTAQGRLFCAGGDLGDYGRMKTAAQGKAVNRKITAALEALAVWPKPTACVVLGDCFGGGVELISAFDRVFCVPEAMLGLWQRRVALSFGWGGGARLERRLGLKRLQGLALEARTFSAYEAREIGLVDDVVLLTQALAVAEEWIEKTAALPSAPVSGLKGFVASVEKKLFEKLWWNDEHRSVLMGRRKTTRS